MAIKVPTPETSGLGTVEAQAADTPVQTLRLPDMSFNARMLQQLGGAAVQFAEYRQEQEDERALLELQAFTGNWERELLYGELPDGTSTGQGGILALQEKDAFGLTERVERDMANVFNEYGANLTGLSRSGQLAAQQYAQGRREQLLNQVARYEFSQREAYNARLRREAAAAAQRAAETAWSTPEAMAAGEARVISSATNQAIHEFAGIPDVQERERLVQASVDAAVEQFHRTAIMRAVGQGEAKLGRELYAQAVENGTITLEPDDLLTRTVQYGEQIDVVINGATLIYDQFPNDLGSAVSAARSMGLDGDTERDLVAELERRYSSAAAADAQRREQTFDAARQSALRGTLFQDFDTGQLAQFTPSERTDLEILNGGGVVVGDTTLYRTIRQLPANELATYDLNAVVGRLTPQQWETLLADRAAARREVAEGANYEWTGIRTEQVTIDTTITAMGIDTDQVAERNAVYLLIEAERNRRIAAGESWTPRDIQIYADVLNSEVAVEEGWVYGYNTAPLWRVLSGEKPVAFPVPGVPPDAVDQIGRLLAEEGTAVTPENIRAVYDRASAAAQGQ